jgi:hypothetical protein
MPLSSSDLQALHYLKKAGPCRPSEVGWELWRWRARKRNRPQDYCRQAAKLLDRLAGEGLVKRQDFRTYVVTEAGVRYLENEGRTLFGAEWRSGGAE